jgi:putative ABC transport system permease protein
LERTFDPDVKNLVGKTVKIGFKSGKDGMIQIIPLKVSGIATKGLITNINTFVDLAAAKKIYEAQNAESPNFNKHQSFTFLLNSPDEKQMAEIKDKLGSKGFSGTSVADIEKRTYDAINLVRLGLNLFAFIALLAASFGIINTLVIAVMERTKEIGLQKALGMGEGKVFLQFSIESILIGFWGALLGIAGGMVSGFAVNGYLAYAYVQSFEGYRLFVFTPLGLLLILLLVCTIAFLAGVIPAFRASRLNPIEALRYE